MPRLIAALIRHGDYQQRPDTPSAHQPFPLTPLGEQQAHQAGLDIAAYATEHALTLHPIIDCSSLLRAWQTARLLADALPGTAPYSLHSTMALAERSVGIAANLTIAEIESLLAQDPRCDAPPDNWKSNSHYCLPLPGAESLMTAGERVARHLQQRTAEPVATDTLKVFVGHGAALRHAAFHLGVLTEPQIPRLSMFHARPVYLEKTADGWQHIAGDWKQRGGESYSD